MLLNTEKNLENETKTFLRMVGEYEPWSIRFGVALSPLLTEHGSYLYAHVSCQTCSPQRSLGAQGVLIVYFKYVTSSFNRMCHTHTSLNNSFTSWPRVIHQLNQVNIEYKINAERKGTCRVCRALYIYFPCFSFPSTV